MPAGGVKVPASALTLGGRSYGVFGAAKFALVTVANDPANLAMFLYATVFMDTAAAGLTKAQEAVIATKPPRRPLQAIPTSGLRSENQM